MALVLCAKATLHFLLAVWYDVGTCLKKTS